jgi:hypothetical protein
MKAVYFTIAGDAWAEDIDESARAVELDDGEHPITKKSVYQDYDHYLDPVFFAYQGIADPEGDDAAAACVHETDRLKLRHVPTHVDTRFWRRLIDHTWKALNVLAVIFMCMSIYVVAWVFIWVYFRVMLPI